MAQVVLASMPLLRRPAACLRRPAAAALASPALPQSPDAPPACDVEAWALQLVLGSEPKEVEQYVSTVYPATFARLLSNTLAASPQLRDPSTLTREQMHARTSQQRSFLHATTRFKRYCPAPKPTGHLRDFVFPT